MTDRLDDTADGTAPESVSVTSPSAGDSTGAGGPAADEELPGNRDDLAVGHLATTKQWMTLAALALHLSREAVGQQALHQLATHGGDPTAFSWLWALMSDQVPQSWNELVEVPSPLTVPPHLVDAVAAEVSATRSRLNQRTNARVHLLKALDPQDPGTARIAWAVLADGASPYEETVPEAIRLLGASRDPAVRAQVLQAATKAARAETPRTRRRAELVAALSLPLDAAEVRATQDALDALTESQAWVPTWTTQHAPWAWPLLKTLAKRVPADHLAQLLNRPWITDTGDSAVATELFTASFDPDVIDEVLQQAMLLVPTVRAALVKSLATVPDPQGLQLVQSAYRSVPLRELASLHSELVDLVNHSWGMDSPVYAQSRRRLQAAALAVPRACPADMSEHAWAQTRSGATLHDDGALLAWASVLSPGQVSQVPLNGLSTDQLVHLGAAAGLLLHQARHSASSEDPRTAAAEGDVLQVLADTDDATCAALLEGLSAVAAGILPDGAFRLALEAGSASTAVVAAADPAPTTAVFRQVVASHRAGGGPVATHATDVANVQWVRWRSERALDLLESVPPDATSIMSVAELVGTLPWNDLADLDLLARAGTALAARPTLFAGQLSAAVSGLGDPSLASGCAARLPVLIDQVLASPTLAEELASGAGLDMAALIREVLDSGDEDLERAGQRWLVAAAPTAQVLHLAVECDQDSALEPSPYAATRAAHARTLCQQALDRAQPVNTRMEALHLAAHADAQQAHRAAATLLAWHLDRTAALPTTKRREVAEVFATTPAAPDDAGLGERLLAAEQDAAVRACVQRALRRLRSDTLEDVLTGLLACVGLSGEVGPLDPAICAAQPQWSDRLRPHVDELLQVTSVHAPPRSVVHQMSVLGDLLSEHAVASVWEATGTDKNIAKAAKLRDNAADKEDIGYLATAQGLQEKLKWLGSQSTLHDMRNGHAAPRGSTRPREITDRDALIATGLLGYVVTGWAQQLYDAAGQTLPDGTS